MIADHEKALNSKNESEQAEAELDKIHEQDKQDHAKFKQSHDRSAKIHDDIMAVVQKIEEISKASKAEDSE
jgi:hypothetical protein